LDFGFLNFKHQANDIWDFDHENNPAANGFQFLCGLRDSARQF